MKRALLLVPTFCFALLFAATTSAKTAEPSARQIWQLIDYIGVDYGGAVANGAIISTAEYAEMRDFTEQAMQQARGLPDKSGKAEVVLALQELREAVERKADPVQVSRLARTANTRLLAVYVGTLSHDDAMRERGAQV